MEKRIHPRMEGTKYPVNVSDGQKFFSEYANNLSRLGLRLEDILKKLEHTARRLSVVISGDGQSFKMRTRSCWTKEGRFSKIIGLEIINASWGWAEFVMAREPAFETSRAKPKSKRLLHDLSAPCSLSEAGRSSPVYSRKTRHIYIAYAFSCMVYL